VGEVTRDVGEGEFAGTDELDGWRTGEGVVVFANESSGQVEGRAGIRVYVSRTLILSSYHPSHTISKTSSESCRSERVDCYKR
jgi:hypothetical protein